MEMWRQSQCCGGPREEIVQVDLFGDGRIIGLVALNQILEQLYTLGRPPDTSVQDELLKRVAAKNYVPNKDEPIYRAALGREYANFYAKKQNQGRNE
ncbi:MAG: NAC family transcription factor [Chloroflexi bacterium]|nr:NAC family transcription factor [Chloroflexota bacterium]